MQNLEAIILLDRERVFILATSSRELTDEQNASLSVLSDSCARWQPQGHSGEGKGATVELDLITRHLDDARGIFLILCMLSEIIYETSGRIIDA